jgi:hypothetical protein
MVVVVLFWKLERSLKAKQKKRWRRKRESEGEWMGSASRTPCVMRDIAQEVLGGCDSLG